MNYLSICSGIEAATVAWKPLGWKAAAFAEIEKFPAAVLAHHYPDIPNHGDITRFKEWPTASIDLLVGGTPCQSFSVAGLRGGLDDPRGNLCLTYLAIAERYRPRWVVWENVPGVLSSNGGRDFGTFLGGLGQLGYGFAYRVLDAQYLGVPQRRRRVFVVGYLGDWRRAAAVLFERQSLSGDSPPSRETRKDVAPCLSARTQGGGGLGTDFDLDGRLVAPPLTSNPYGDHESREGLLVAHTLNAKGGIGRQDAETETFVIQECGARASKNQNGIGIGVSQNGPMYTLQAGQQHGVCQVTHSVFVQNTRDEVRLMGGDGQITGALAAESGMKQQPYVLMERGRNGESNLEYRQDGTANAILTPNGGRGGLGVGAIAQSSVRRLTPLECERLQGFFDDYTLIPYRGKPAADGPRYKALGNSMAVPVMRWIGERIAKLESVLRPILGVKDLFQFDPSLS